MIVVDVRYIRERPSGISPYAQALVDLLPSLAPDLQFHFLKHPRAPARLSRESNVRETVVPYDCNGPVTMWGLPRVVDFAGAQLYHGTFNIQPAALPVPAVISLHDVMWLKYPHWARNRGFWGYCETAFYQHGIRRTLAKAARILTISHATSDEIASVAPAARARTRFTGFGISDDWRPANGDDDRATMVRARGQWLGGAERYVLTVGQWAPYKNHVAVLRAFARAFAKDASMHMVFVQRLGEGSRILGALAKTLGVESRVHILRAIPFEDLRALFWGATALCHPSLYEGFGNPPSEALASGCPVVTSNRSSMPEVSGDAALLVDPESDEAIANALSRVASDPSLADGMRTRGLARAATMRWSAIVPRVLAAYREVLSDAALR
jgi:glycosyltransferase involved in cell wall biosynthesis